MPHEWNNTWVVTKDELVPDWYTWPALKVAIHRYQDKPYGIKKVRTGGGGHPMLIDFDSLPLEIRNGLGDPRSCDHILERFYKIDGEAVDFYSSFTFEEDGTALDLEHQERYIINASVLNALQALKEAREAERKAKGGTLTGILESLRTDAISFNKTLKARHGVMHTLPESDRRFRQAFREFEANRYRSLISGKHRNSNGRKVDEKTFRLLNSMFGKDKTKPTATEVERRYQRFLDGQLEVIVNGTGEVYNPKQFKKLSARTVTSYLAQWKSKIGTYAARSGNRQVLMGQFKTPHSMDRPTYAGSLLSIDDRQPPFKCLELDGDRVWFYNALDVASDAFVCCVHGKDKKGLILEFYRQLVRNYAGWGFNLPAELEAEMSLNSMYLNSFLREGAMFQHVRIEANNARGKIIESRFNPLRHTIEKDLEGWQPRPFDKRESHQAGPDKVPVLPYEKIVKGSIEAIVKWNNLPHPERPELTRFEYFCENQNPELRPTNYKAFLRDIGHRTPTSCNVGQIRLNNDLFLLGDSGSIATGEKLVTLMDQVEGRDLDIFWLDDNNGKVLKALVYLRGGERYICEAIAKPTYNRARVEQTPEDVANRELMSKYVATLEGYARRQKAALEPLTLIESSKPAKKTFVMPGIHKPAPAARPESDRVEILMPPSEFELEPAPSRNRSKFDRW